MTTTATPPVVLFEKRGRVGLITLNRPERLNAWSAEMQEMLRASVEECNGDDQVGAIVITGAGRGFCSGADLRRDRNADAAPRPRTEPEALPFFLQRSKPLIAAINGPAVGIGLTLTLCCDVRLASDQARLSARFVRIGLTPELGSTFFLPQITTLGYAAELMLTGRIIDAKEAERVGLVNRVVPHGELIDAAIALGEEIAFNPTQHVRWTKRLLYANAASDNLRAVLQAEDEIFGQATRTEAFAEAGRAFAEKRDPRFHG
ncbi:MAG TPA: enoyl-CoA hydratase-related protein [Dehalococcoidia bacterium]|nr:enoyl-CoA hydratase-related protein [Dehalococcoidia bacterium]